MPSAHPRSLAPLAAAFAALLCLWGLLSGLQRLAPRDAAAWPATSPPRRLRIDRAGETVILAQASTGPWMLEAPFRCQASEEEVGRFLKRLMKAKLSEPVGSDPARHSLFSLSEPGATRLRAFAGPEEGTPGLDLLIGSAGASWDAFFVRRPGGDAVFELRGGSREDIDRPAGRWADLTVCSFDPSRILSLEVRRRGSRVLLRQDSGSWFLGASSSPLPAGTVSRALRPALSALERLQADDIKPDSAVHPLILKGLETPETEVLIRSQGPLGHGDERTFELSLGPRSPEFDHPARRKGLDGLVYFLKPYRLEELSRLTDLK